MSFGTFFPLVYLVLRQKHQSKTAKILILRHYRVLGLSLSTTGCLEDTAYHKAARRSHIIAGICSSGSSTLINSIKNSSYKTMRVFRTNSIDFFIRMTKKAMKRLKTVVVKDSKSIKSISRFLRSQLSHYSLRNLSIQIKKERQPLRLGLAISRLYSLRKIHLRVDSVDIIFSSSSSSSMRGWQNRYYPFWRLGHLEDFDVPSSIFMWAFREGFRFSRQNDVVDLRVGTFKHFRLGHHSYHSSLLSCAQQQQQPQPQPQQQQEEVEVKADKGATIHYPQQQDMLMLLMSRFRGISIDGFYLMSAVSEARPKKNNTAVVDDDDDDDDVLPHHGMTNYVKRMGLLYSHCRPKLRHMSLVLFNLTNYSDWESEILHWILWISNIHKEEEEGNSNFLSGLETLEIDFSEEPRTKRIFYALGEKINFGELKKLRLISCPWNALIREEQENEFFLRQSIPSGLTSLSLMNESNLPTISASLPFEIWLSRLLDEHSDTLKHFEFHFGKGLAPFSTPLNQRWDLSGMTGLGHLQHLSFSMHSYQSIHQSHLTQILESPVLINLITFKLDLGERGVNDLGIAVGGGGGGGVDNNRSDNKGSFLRRLATIVSTRCSQLNKFLLKFEVIIPVMIIILSKINPQSLQTPASDSVSVCKQILEDLRAIKKCFLKNPTFKFSLAITPFPSYECLFPILLEVMNLPKNSLTYDAEYVQWINHH